MIIDKNITSINIKSKSLGELYPRHNNDTDIGLIKNRQVIITFEKNATFTRIDGSITADGHAAKDVKIFYKNELVHDSTISNKEGKFVVYAPDKTPINIYTDEKKYFNQSHTITPDSTKKNNIAIDLTELTVNKEINLKNILFYSNKNVIRNGVEDVLYTLTKNFLINQEYCFEIQGHVNGVDKQPSWQKYYKDLSEARAGAIYFYMKEHGISPERMVPTGYSNEKMLFPNNPSYDQQVQNMRVVLKILECSEVKNRRQNFSEENWKKITKARYFNDLDAQVGSPIKK
jgi:outer membrane protein OmpA-like peptidoglycan-associated protein